MQKHLLYINLFAITSALALGACADEVENAVTPDVPEIGEKTPIELFVGGVEGVKTRAVITDRATPKTFDDLDNGTKVFMLMKSDYVSLNNTALDFGGSQDTKYCVTSGVVADGENTGDPKVVSMTDDDTYKRVRYWDDIHARSSRLSIWAITCPGMSYLGGIGTQWNDSNVPFVSTTGLKTWQTTEINATAIEWNVPHYNEQNGEKYFNATNMKDRDLCFSNNIADYSSASNTDRRLKFVTSGTKHFEGGELVFYHALSKITININIGDGFIGSNDFRFTGSTSDENVLLQYFNIWGKFNIVSGEWSVVNNEHQAIMGMNNLTGATPNITDNSKPTYQLEALVIPYLESDSKTIKGSLINGDATTAIAFSIDHNKYEISRAILLKALQDKADNGVASDATDVKLEAGKNYIFTFTVGKTKIKNISAKVAQWEEVDADLISPSNARITLSLQDPNSPYYSNITNANGNTFSIYRLADDNTGAINDNYAAYNWNKTGYSNSEASLSYVSTDPAHWETGWYWNSNKNFYHFRALGEVTNADQSNIKITAAPAISTETDANGGDYITLQSGPGHVGGSTSYKDICWGAPFAAFTGSKTMFTYSPYVSDSEKGYGFDGTTASTSHQIYKAIGPTENQIKLVLFHMMSELNIKINTTTGSDAVTLVDNTTDPANPVYTKVQLEGYYPMGKVLLGNGSVQPTGDKTSSDRTAPLIARTGDDGGYQIYNYGVVPQGLTGVQLRITTPDNNEYIVDMSTVKATSITTKNIENPYQQSNGKYTINSWYPGFKYTYNLTLKKTGIDDLQATIVNWETVTADNETVTIK